MAASINQPHRTPFRGSSRLPEKPTRFLLSWPYFLVVAVLAVGLLFLRLHTLPERMAHKSQKLQFEIVAVLGLLALFTHTSHLLGGRPAARADRHSRFGTPLRRMAGSLEKIAGIPPGEGAGCRTRPVQFRRRRTRRAAVKPKHRARPRGADPCLNFFSARC